MILKTLISMLRCVWLGLELNSAGKWISRARFQHPWSMVCSFQRVACDAKMKLKFVLSSSQNTIRIKQSPLTSTKLHTGKLEGATYYTLDFRSCKEIKWEGIQESKMASGQNVCFTQAEPLGRCRQHSRQMTGPGCFSEHLVKLHRANIGPVTNTCQCTPTLSPSSGRCETEASQTSGSIPLIVISTLLRFHQILLRNRFTLGSVYLNLSLLFKYRRLYALKTEKSKKWVRCLWGTVMF